jgi:hypothetical protein
MIERGHMSDGISHQEGLAGPVGATTVSEFTLTLAQFGAGTRELVSSGQFPGGNRLLFAERGGGAN